MLRRGYLVEYVGFDHPMALEDGMAYTHRLVMSKKIGRPLTSDEIVHHIDGNKLNNDPDNLMIVTAAEHNRIHKLRERKAERPCVICGTMTSNPKVCSRECAIKYAHLEGRPNKDILEEDLKTMSIRQMAKKYKVGTAVVRRWLKKHGLY